jgi:thiamine-phosphate pyrophosphorylase
MLLYYITDRGQFPGDEAARRRALLTKITEATRAGVDYIQLREKDLSARELEQLAREAVRIIHELKAANQEVSTRLLINSRTDVALAVDADGVHLRSNDIGPADVQQIWLQAFARSPQAETYRPLIAVSCHSQADVLRACAKGAHFAVFAPVFEKKAQPETKPSGLQALRQACEVKIPVFALGGITIENVGACLEAGAAGIAAIRLFQENRIDEVIRVLKEMIRSQTR